MTDIREGVNLDLNNINEEYTKYVNILQDFFNQYFPQFSSKLTIRCFKKNNVDEYRLFVNSFDDCLINALQNCLSWNCAHIYYLEIDIYQFNNNWDNDEKYKRFNEKILRYYQRNYDHFTKYISKFIKKFDTLHESVDFLPTDLSLHICSFLYDHNYGKFYVQYQEILNCDKIDSVDCALSRQSKLVDFESRFSSIIHP